MHSRLSAGLDSSSCDRIVEGPLVSWASAHLWSSENLAAGLKLSALVLLFADHAA